MLAKMKSLLSFLKQYLGVFRISRRYAWLEIGSLMIAILQSPVEVYFLGRTVNAHLRGDGRAFRIFALLYFSWYFFRHFYMQISRYYLLEAKAKMNYLARDGFVDRLFHLPYWRYENSESLNLIEMVDEEYISNFADNHLALTLAFRSFFRVATISSQNGSR